MYEVRDHPSRLQASEEEDREGLLLGRCRGLPTQADRSVEGEDRLEGMPSQERREVGASPFTRASKLPTQFQCYICRGGGQLGSRPVDGATRLVCHECATKIDQERLHGGE